MLQLLSEVNVVFVGAGFARPPSPFVISLSQRVGNPHPYEACYFSSHSKLAHWHIATLTHYFLCPYLSTIDSCVTGQ